MEREKESIFSKITIKDILTKKHKEKITMLTCYDTSFAQIIDEAGVDIILVGDSMANVVLGIKRTKDISFKEMFNHTQAVRRGVKRALVVADMPYVSYQKNKKKAIYFAKKFLEEAGADAVKIEWFDGCQEIGLQFAQNRIPLMGHIGLTPQSVDKLGGFSVQGRDYQRAHELIEQAKLFQDWGSFSLVLECIPSQLSKLITDKLSIPTIGIGAGPSCDGQVIVLYDLLGLYRIFKPKFVRVYVDLSQIILDAVKKFILDVKEARFPLKEESFLMKEEELSKLKEII
ncbi:MAG: 3-methyl-2-oxobutanoate hydroxymethyltransferase [Candidatus Omnitrophica bacterium]|nr:3-methyl-2-oxobutanoate hydroxymethyltransferase [Candidatus Omnitrophota bacterium]